MATNEADRAATHKERAQRVVAWFDDTESQYLAPSIQSREFFAMVEGEIADAVDDREARLPELLEAEAERDRLRERLEITKVEIRSTATKLGAKKREVKKLNANESKLRDENRRLREALELSRELIGSQELGGMIGLTLAHGGLHARNFQEKAERAKALADELLKD